MASLVYHAGALGDFITTLPALRAWRRLHSQERITLLGKPAYASIAGCYAAWDEVWDVESARFAHLFAPLDQACSLRTPTEERPAAYRQGGFSCFTSALLFSPASSPLRANLQARGVQRIVWQAPFPASAVPIVDYHLSLFPTLELSPDDRVPLIDTGAQEAVPAFPSLEGRPMVAIHPGSGSAAKNWPLERFQELARELEGLGQSVVWVMGPAEGDLVPQPGARIWRGLPLAALGAALSRCRLYVGNDSGVTHLAAAASVPTVALFVASNSIVWKPRGRRVFVLEGTSPTTIQAETVLRSCKMLLAE